MVFVKWPTGHECQLWVDEVTGKMYYYDMAQWLEYEQSAWNNGRTYWPTWETVDWDDDMWVYDTNNPTDLFTWESGDKVSYVFKDWNGTVLKEGKVNEWTAPTAPADPTRESTAEYTYTFTGWNPTVAPITKKTTYTAQYEASPRNYTVTIGVSPEWAGTVDTQQVTVAYGTEISYTSNVLMIGDNEITATAWSGYDFSSWWTLPATVTENLTITATFASTGYLLTFAPWDEVNNQEWGWTVSPTTAYAPVGSLLFVNDSDSTDAEIRTWNPDSDPDAQLLTSITSTADAERNYDGWYVYNESTQEWDYHYATFLPITGNMQLRYYFKSLD